MVTMSVDNQLSQRKSMLFMLNKIDPSGRHMAVASMEEAFEKLTEDVQIVFMDIEMPGMNGLEGARLLKEKYDRINVIFITGHPEYSLESYSVHPSGFLIKPVTEQDLKRELQELRYPIEQSNDLIIKCHPFGIFVGEKPFNFKRDRSMELFAYLVYKNGAFCTIGEALGILWEGNNDKKDYLRQLVVDIKKCFAEIGVEEIIIKKYGKVAVYMSLLHLEGDRNDIINEFLWF